MKIKMIYEMIAHHYINKKKVTLPCDMSDNKKLLILATGTSASEFWNDCAERWKNFQNYDIMVMNRSIYKMKEQIFRLKPKYFAACDSIYWGADPGKKISSKLAEETYQKTKEVLEEINWDCFLITTIQEHFCFTNPKVKIIRINTVDYDSNHSWTYWLYKNNFAQPAVHNVAQLGIYYGITFGYKEVGLVGIDFDFIKNIHCDKECKVGIYAEHQYEGKATSVYLDRDVVGLYNNSVMAKYIYQTAEAIACFGKLSMYAERMNCKIYNYSLNSLLDCYEKKSLDGQERDEL